MHSITRHCASLMSRYENIYNHGMTYIPNSQYPWLQSLHKKRTMLGKVMWLLILTMVLVYVDPRYLSSCQVATSLCLNTCVTCMNYFMHIKEYCQGTLVDHGHLVRFGT